MDRFIQLHRNIHNAAVWPRVPDLIKTAVGNTVEPFALDCDVDHVGACPAVANDPKATEVIDRCSSCH